MEAQDQESIPTKTDVKVRLREFGYYFVQSFEQQLEFFRDILEENPNTSGKSTSLPVTITSGLAAAIPTVGKSLSAGLQQGEKFVVNRIDKKNAITMADVVYFHGNVTEVVRDILIQGVFDVFYCFERQFMQVTTNGGETRAMQKLALDASHRLITYLLENYEGGYITSEIVVKGILKGDSKRHKLGIRKSGRSLVLKTTEVEVTTSCLYTRAGICLRNAHVAKFYKNKKSMTDLIGHRLLFHWENSEDIERDWKCDDISPPYEYQLNLTDKEEEIKNIRQYIISKHPLEDIKEFAKLNFEEQVKLHGEASLERRENLSELLEDTKSKHEETVQVIEGTHSEIIETIKASQQEIFKHTDEKVSEVKENVNEKHAELSENLEVIRHEICETRSAASATEETLVKKSEELQQDISELKEHHAESEKYMALQINRNELKKVQETFKQIDPVRAITRSGEFKKLKKRFRL